MTDPIEIIVLGVVLLLLTALAMVYVDWRVRTVFRREIIAYLPKDDELLDDNERRIVKTCLAHKPQPT